MAASTETAAAEGISSPPLRAGLKCSPFRKSEVLLGNQEIAARCNLPKSTVSRLTFTLTRLGYLHYVEPLAKYRLGTAVLALGTSMLAKLDVRNIARPLMEELATFSNAHLGLGARDRLSMVYLECFRGQAAVSLTLDVGSRISISTSALGKAFLAACTEEERAPILGEIRAIDETPGRRPGTRSQRRWRITARWVRLLLREWQGQSTHCGGFRQGRRDAAMAVNCGRPAWWSARISC